MLNIIIWKNDMLLRKYSNMCILTYYLCIYHVKIKIHETNKWKN